MSPSQCRTLTRAVAKWKQSLIHKVLRIQRKVSCTGCGLCCTERFNTVRIVPLEAAVIAWHLRGLPEKTRLIWEQRLQDTVDRYHLVENGPSTGYTCAFLEADFSCALPFAVKPVACLAFNPVSRDRCEQNQADYFSVFDQIERQRTDQRESNVRSAIPVLVLRFLRQLRTQTSTRRRTTQKTSPHGRRCSQMDQR